MSLRTRLAAAASCCALLAAAPAMAQSTAYNAPNFIGAAGATQATLGGVTFVNQGLVGTARLPANLHDFNGETLGSFSGMAIDLKTWRRQADGTYTASLFTLPDRGPNNIGGFTTTNYAARLNQFTVSLNPYAGAAALPSTTQQAALTQAGGFLLRDETGQLFTGRDPRTGVVVRNGIAYPTPPAGDPGAGKITLDPEAVTFLADGSFYVGDEYAAGIYYFDATGRQIGAIQANPDLLPRVNGAVNFNGTNDSPLVAGSTGRRSNQGMEGISVSPDGTRLFAVLQSATLQDNPTNVAVRRNNTRVLVYDITASRTPGAPVAEYVLQLPVFNNSATGNGAATATAAQSEVLALNNTQFLVLSRDGNGRGSNGNANAIAFKSVLLVDVTGATNIAGTPYSTGTTPISTTAAANGSGALVAGVTPVQQVELVNMLNTTQLSKFGINTKTNPSTQFTLSEKWEAMGLAPVLEESAPQDFFLFIGNDNDFVSDDIDAAGVTNANAALNSPTAGVGNNDNVMMVYRLTLPTYVDPQALAAMRAAAPFAIAGARIAGAEMTALPAGAAMDALGAARRARAAGGEAAGYRAWAQGEFDRVAAPGAVGPVDAAAFTVGVENGGGGLRYGAALSATDYQSRDERPFDIRGYAYSLGVYGGYFADSGLYAQAAASLGKLRVKTARPSAYGLTARGSADGNGYAVALQVGYAAELGGLRVAPFAELAYSKVELDSYAERGASVGNALIPENDYDRTEATVGVEATFAPGAAVRPTLRLAYTQAEEGGDSQANLSLAAAPGSAGLVALPESDDGYFSAGAALEGDWRGFAWRAAIEARDTDDEVSGRAALGFSKAF